MPWKNSHNPEKSWLIAADLPKEMLIQDERKVRVVLSSPDESGNRQVTKIYRTPLALTWRDLFRIPQAQREFENTQYAHDRGLPVVEPLGWELSRRPGRDWFSQLSTVYLEGDTLREVLGKSGIGAERRAELIHETGRLMAALHGKGLIWSTAHSGNIMVNPHSGRELTAFDLPYALCTGNDMIGTRYALYDLICMAHDFRKLCQLEKPLINLLFSAYAEAAELDPEKFCLSMESVPGKKAFSWERICLRTLKSFRLQPL
jgi:hypothetical protein